MVQSLSSKKRTYRFNFETEYCQDLKLIKFGLHLRPSILFFFVLLTHFGNLHIFRGGVYHKSETIKKQF
jgi:hypothetical protein